MSDRHLPVVPTSISSSTRQRICSAPSRRGDAAATAEILKHHPEKLVPSEAQLADAQLALARSYGLPSWPRLVLACRMTDAICRDDLDTVRDLVVTHPYLLHEDARGVKGNWGPPMSYAANLGRDRIIAMLHEQGAVDVQFAFDRACLQGEIETARRLCALGARPVAGSVMGPCETLNAAGLSLLLELGAEIMRRARRPARARGHDPRRVRSAPGGKARVPRDRRPPRHRAARYGADGRPPRPDRSAGTTSAARSGAALADVHSRGDLSAGARLSRRPLAGAARDPARRRDAAAPLRRHDEIEIARWMLERGARRQREGGGRRRRLRRTHAAVRLRGVAAISSRGRVRRLCPTPARSRRRSRTSARRCASGCGSWTMRRCTNTATSRRSAGVSGFTIRAS